MNTLRIPIVGKGNIRKMNGSDGRDTMDRIEYLEKMGFTVTPGLAKEKSGTNPWQLVKELEARVVTTNDRNGKLRKEIRGLEAKNKDLVNEIGIVWKQVERERERGKGKWQRNMFPSPFPFPFSLSPFPFSVFPFPSPSAFTFSLFLFGHLFVLRHPRVLDSSSTSSVSQIALQCLLAV